MNSYASLRKKNTGHSVLWIMIVVLLIFEFCSLSVLFSQLVSYAPVDHRTYIDLTEGNDVTQLEIIRRELSGGSRGAGLSRASLAPHTPYRSRVLDENSDKVGFWTYDQEQIWNTTTDVEIFRIHHDNNGDLVFTVVTSDGDKVFAPGTENRYDFAVRNTNTVSLDYILQVEAYFKGTDDLWIPIQARMFDGQGNYLVGGAEDWPDVLELNTVDRKDVLSAGNIRNYSLEWRWPFERGEVIQEGLYKGDYTEDFYDTMLGNLAVDQDLELHIIIRTSAWLDENPEEPGGDRPVPTGDANNPMLWVILAGTSLVLLLVLLILAWRNRRKSNEEV